MRSRASISVAFTLPCISTSFERADRLLFGATTSSFITFTTFSTWLAARAADSRAWSSCTSPVSSTCRLYEVTFTWAWLPIVSRMRLAEKSPNDSAARY